MKKHLLYEIPAAILMFLYLYASFSKYFDLQEFRHAMRMQPFPPFLRTAMFWGLPPVEIVTSVLLVISRTRKFAYSLSMGLLIAFTLYIGIILLDFFPHVPCTCGGLISKLTWKQHLIFNIIFIGINIWGLRTMKASDKKYFSREIGLRPGPEKTGVINH